MKLFTFESENFQILIYATDKDQAEKLLKIAIEKTVNCNDSPKLKLNANSKVPEFISATFTF